MLLILQETLEIVMSRKVTLETLKLLQLKIADYSTLLTDKYPKSLKLKHHFLVHYLSVMQQVGPFSHINCMKFESKYWEMKQITYF